MKIDILEKLDLYEANKLIRDGYLKKGVHPNGELFIYNYTEKTQFHKRWCNITLQCRGLICDKDGNIISRPFPKFFGIDEYKTLRHPEIMELPDEPFYIYEKLDGSLGISYFIRNEMFIATRGSFVSKQSQVATEMLKEKYKHIIFNPKYTYLFEIIYPENRIVVDYKQESKLVLIGSIDIGTGYDSFIDYYGDKNNSVCDFINPDNLELEASKKIEHKINSINDVDKLKDLYDGNKEGFVIRFQSGLRVKYKFPMYVQLHSIVFQVTEKKIWKYLKDYNYELVLEPLLNALPPIVSNYIEKTVDDFDKKFMDIENECISDMKKCGINMVSDDISGKCYRDYNEEKKGDYSSIVLKTIIVLKKSFAEKAKTFKYPHVLFKMYDEKPYEDAIWKLLEPKHEIPIMEIV